MENENQQNMKWEKWQNKVLDQNKKKGYKN